eukprot:6492668-Amphidinium_carterae.1
MIWQSLGRLETAITGTQGLLQTTVANHLALNTRVITLESAAQSSTDTTLSPQAPQQPPTYDIPRLFQGVLKRLEYMQRRYEVNFSAMEENIKTMTNAWRQREHNKQTEAAITKITNSMKEKKEWFYDKLAELEVSKEKDIEVIAELKTKIDDLEQTLVQVVDVIHHQTTNQSLRLTTCRAIVLPQISLMQQCINCVQSVQKECGAA